MTTARERLSIAHVSDSLEVGGAEIVLATLARLHKADGHRVSVHCLYAEGALAEELRRDGIEVFAHGRDSAAGRVWRLRQSLRKIRPDVVHCHNAAATIYGAPIARLLSVPVVLSTRHSLANRPLFRQEMKFWIAARLFCRTVVAVSEAVRRSMEAHALSVPSKLAMIRNGAAAAAGTKASESRQVFTLVNVARLTVLKDHMTLLKAVAIARETVPDLEVWIVGDGEQGANLRAFVREAGMSQWVHLAGERKDVGTYLSRADVFVLSSRTEGLPISLLEAMASGLPAISTEVGGIPEVAALSGACELVPPAQPEALAQAICRYAANRKQLPGLGARARRCYELWFSPERMANEYMQLYRGSQPTSAVDSSICDFAMKREWQ
jgi:glycosyltransferase involved in cell wall biosynthesis